MRIFSAARVCGVSANVKIASTNIRAVAIIVIAVITASLADCQHYKRRRL